MRVFVLIIFFGLVQTFSKAHAQLDVVHYQFHLSLTDASDTIVGRADVTFRFAQPAQRVALNLVSPHNGRGMVVERVSAHDTTFSFTQPQDSLVILLPQTLAAGRLQTVSIHYKGIPADGFVISKNSHGARTFFADNWPNRARHWLPCNDRIDDKATVGFVVTAPAHYTIIANGVKQSEEPSGAGFTRTTWLQAQPIPTKVVVAGAARFAVRQYADSSITPVSAWVFPQDSTKGFYDYELAPPIVRYFSNYIGPYPFQKLANVQAITIFGGLENASAIFYAEKTVTGTRQSEGLLAHEIAHQWFGNSATEKSFAHLWLSEGFATYFTHLYLEQKYGQDTLQHGLQKDRAEIVRFARQWPKPVVDTASAPMDLLNANSYQKGGWVLHMLRRTVGDTVFQNIVRSYYDTYKFRNADTWDFEKVASEISGQNLRPFFQQWLYTPGIPKLRVVRKKDQVVLVQEGSVYTFPITIRITTPAGKITNSLVPVTQKETVLPVAMANAKITLDPNVNLLFEELK